MATLSTSIRQNTATPGFAVAARNAAVSGFGAMVVGTFEIVGAVVQWAGKSHSWIFFFLALKPLIDLTWRWSFFRFSGQSVNTQAIVGLSVLMLNGFAVLKNEAWRRVPRRVTLMLAFASLSVVFSPSSWGGNELLRLLAGTTFFYTAGPLLADAKQFDRFSKVFLLAMTVPVVLSYFQWVGVLPYEYWDWLDGESVNRASGTYPTPLSMSFFLYYAFPLALSIAGGKVQGTQAKAGALVFLVLASGALALGNHRTAYIIVALQVFMWLAMTSGRKAVLVFLAVLSLVVVLSFGWLQTLSAPIGDALSGKDDMENGQFLRGRGFQWLLFLNSYASSGPFHWVTGNGASTIAGYDPEDTEIDSVEPHNDYIRILHAYGIVGLLLYLSTLALFLKRSIRLLRSAEEFPRRLAQIMLLAIVAILIQSVVMEPMRYPTGVWYLFAIGSALFCVKAGPARTEGSPA
jgi:O-antigen ligase